MLRIHPAHTPYTRANETRTPSVQVEKAMQEKEGAIVRAQGEAQSARLIGQAIQQNPAFLTLRKIEVSTARNDAQQVHVRPPIVCHQQ
jgi:regulator of protease activity HflC (stomatin/prohibitin superfamily)